MNTRTRKKAHERNDHDDCDKIDCNPEPAFTTPQEIAWSDAQIILANASQKTAECEIAVVAAERDHRAAAEAHRTADARLAAAHEAKAIAVRDLEIAISRLHETKGGVS
jgi:hypothetical protein